MNRGAESVCRARFSACGQSIQDHGAERGQECADSDREMFGEPKNILASSFAQPCAKLLLPPRRVVTRGETQRSLRLYPLSTIKYSRSSGLAHQRDQGWQGQLALARGGSGMVRMGRIQEEFGRAKTRGKVGEESVEKHAVQRTKDSLTRITYVLSVEFLSVFNCI